MPKRRVLVRILGLLACTALVTSLLSRLTTPVWNDWNNNDTYEGFYQQPKDTVEVVFLGTSLAVCGFSPCQLWEEHGICSYNLASEQQPLIASYYWLREALRLQGGSLRMVVLDCSAYFFQGDHVSALAPFAEKAFAHMRPSQVKADALASANELWGNVSVVDGMIPVLQYHERWQSLGEDDFASLVYAGDAHTRGQMISVSSDLVDAQAPAASPQLSTEGLAYTKEGTVPPSEQVTKYFERMNQHYLTRMIELCEANGIQLVLTCLPRGYAQTSMVGPLTRFASNYDHVSALYLGTRYTMHALGVDTPACYFSGSHLNAWGSRRTMEYVGNYLVKNFELSDRRGDDRYAFMDQAAAEWDRDMADIDLRLCDDLDQYIELASDPRYITLITVKDDAAANLSNKTRNNLRKAGLVGLSRLGYQESYVGVLDGGVAVVDKRQRNTLLAAQSVLELREGVLELASGGAPGSATDTTTISVVSAGSFAGIVASVKVNGAEYSENGRGLNFVVIRRDTGAVVDTATFDTYGDCSRTSDVGLREELAKWSHADESSPGERPDEEPVGVPAEEPAEAHDEGPAEENESPDETTED